MGPLLFPTHINDLPEHITSQVYLFADDSKLLGTVPNIFNADIGHFTDWSYTNKLSINLPKCQYFVQALFPNSITVLGTKTEESSLVKDLGLYISKILTWDKHLKNKLDACYRNFHFIKRTVPSSVNISVTKSIINSCVIELLLYCSHCWSPSITSLKKLLSMHRKCLS